MHLVVQVRMASEVPTHGSQFWSAIQKFKWLFKLGARHLVRNGNQTFFWQDWWMGSGPLHARFPLLFGCCNQPFVTIHGAWILGGGPRDWRLHFRRQFGPAEAIEWENLCKEIHDLPTSLIRPKRVYFLEHFCYCFSSNLCVLNTTNTN
jgi:hypothetical protein